MSLFRYTDLDVQRTVVEGISGINEQLGVEQATFAAGAASGTIATLPFALLSQLGVAYQKDATYAVHVLNPCGAVQGLTAALTTTAAAGANLAANTTYDYEVTAVGPWGETAVSQTAVIAEGATAYEVALSWDAVTGAQTYNVYKAVSGSAVGQLVSGLTATTYTDTGTVATSATTPTASPITGPGVAVTVTCENGVSFGLANPPYYTAVQTNTVSTGSAQTFLVSGWMLGTYGAQALVAANAAVGTPGGSVWVEVTEV